MILYYDMVEKGRGKHIFLKKYLAQMARSY